MSKVNNKSSRYISSVEGIYRCLNEKYFNSELPLPFITIESKVKKCSLEKSKDIVNETATEMYRLSIPLALMNLTIIEVVVEFLHIMIHIYNKEKGITDINDDGYHNENFRIAAESRNLNVVLNGKKGYDKMSATIKLEKFVEDNLSEINWLWLTEAKTDIKIEKKSHHIKYKCPTCGAIITATKPNKYMCMSCNKEMIEYIKTPKE